MKRVYYLLLYMSLREQAYFPCCEVFFRGLNKEMNNCGFKVEFGCLCEFANFVFKELESRFERLFSDLTACKHGEVWAEDLILFLRICMVTLTLIASDQNLLLEKCRSLLSILGVFISLVNTDEDEGASVSLQKSFSSGCTVTDANSTDPSDPFCPFVCTILEAFVDELLRHRSLSGYFMLLDSASSCVLELMSVHFILSLSGEQAFHRYLNRLCWTPHDACREPELGMNTALSLLLNPIMFSAPKMFQAHFISLVSEAIGCGISKNLMPDARLMNCYITAFERSVILYTRQKSCLHMNGRLLNSEASFSGSKMLEGCDQMSFETCVQGGRKIIVKDVISKSDSFWASYIFLRLKSNLLASSVVYLEESQQALDRTFEDIASILHHIVLRASADDVSDHEMYIDPDTSPHDIYLLASILKLMGSSMLHVVWCLRHGRKSAGITSMEDAPLGKQFVGVISCFIEFDIHMPIQKFLCDVMDSHPMMHRDSKWMFLHFCGLLALSFGIGIDFLVKNCIYVLIASFNLLTFEDGGLASLASLLGSGPEIVSKSSYDDVDEKLVEQKCSQVAQQFAERKTLHSSVDSAKKIAAWILSQSSVDSLKEANESMLDEREETSELASICKHEEDPCSGEIILKCLKLSSCHGLTDFIDCEPVRLGQWLKKRSKERSKVRKWRAQWLKKRSKMWKKRAQVLEEKKNPENGTTEIAQKMAILMLEMAKKTRKVLK